MKQSKESNKPKPATLVPKPAFTRSQEKLIKKLENLDISIPVAHELVKASHPQAIKNWIALMEANKQ